MRDNQNRTDPAVAMASLGSAVEITVTYEALYQAAEDVLTQVRSSRENCQSISDLASRMQAVWDSEAGTKNQTAIKKSSETLMRIVEAFQKHAENLQSIAQQYVSGSRDAQTKVETLSADVIV